MKMYLIFLTFITILTITACDYGNTSSFQLKNDSEKVLLNFVDSDIILYNYGKHSGKSIFKLLKHVESKDQHDEFQNFVNNIHSDFRCNLTDAALVCIIFGDEFNKIKSSKIDYISGTSLYNVSIKLAGGNDVTISFEIIKDIGSFDSTFRGIVG